MYEFVDAYDRAYENAAAGHELSVAQACVLGRLDPIKSMGQLAAELACDASNITQIIRRLEARGLVERQANPDDHRSRHIVRTSAGERVYTAFEQSFGFARNAVGNLSPDEREQLSTLLRKTSGIDQETAP